jgi:hypothetical protein
VTEAERVSPLLPETFGRSARWSHTAKRFRPFALLRARTLRPSFVLIRLRKPWVLFLFSFEGCLNVADILASSCLVVTQRGIISTSWEGVNEKDSTEALLPAGNHSATGAAGRAVAAWKPERIKSGV